ncbi:MAG: DHHA1 domain-containing protein [Ignisphaera sp.]|nr:DHHA1 domain-containing protein [Ignisphaera sp.]MCX8168170.1 DHHA1 domain-containing protein [Ignisphaera sp.]MDW8085190.1 DHHA1 domain-containing protein [Ignisphaera sp.]
MRGKAVIMFHGDCDGVISAGLYIRHFLMDFFPSHTVLRYSHPWRLEQDLSTIVKRVGKESIDTIVILDLAIRGTIIDMLLKNFNSTLTNVVIVDHHLSSLHAIEMFKSYNLKVKTYWNSAQSTPQVIANTLVKNLNSYEKFLVQVANVCEGGDADDVNVRDAADKIKLVLAIEPLNEKLITSSVGAVVGGEEFWNSSEFEKKFWKGKWLLQLLLKKIEERIEKVCKWHLASFTITESLIFAGLFGIASSEYIKKSKYPIVLLREEEDKAVITVRSAEGKALDFCKNLAQQLPQKMEGVYGGHREAASLTIKNYESLDKLRSTVREFIIANMC